MDDHAERLKRRYAEWAGSLQVMLSHWSRACRAAASVKRRSRAARKMEDAIHQAASEVTRTKAALLLVESSPDWAERVLVLSACAIGQRWDPALGPLAPNASPEQVADALFTKVDDLLRQILAVHPDLGRNATTPREDHNVVDLLLRAWLDLNETARDAARLRWKITTGYLAGIGAVVAAVAIIATGSGKELSSWWFWTFTALYFAAVIVQSYWQWYYNRFLVRVLKKQQDLTVKLDDVLKGAEVDLSLGGVVSDKEATYGMVSLVAVSVVMTFAAWCFLWF